MTKPKRCVWRPYKRSMDDLYAGRKTHAISCKDKFTALMSPDDIVYCPWCGVKIEIGDLLQGVQEK